MSEIASLRHSRVTTATRHGFIHNLGGHSFQIPRGGDHAMFLHQSGGQGLEGRVALRHALEHLGLVAMVMHVGEVLQVIHDVLHQGVVRRLAGREQRDLFLEQAQQAREIQVFGMPRGQLAAQLSGAHGAPFSGIGPGGTASLAQSPAGRLDPTPECGARADP